MGVRFSPGPFKYNARVAIALVPALLVAAGLGGRVVMGIFTIGTMLWYIMDAMQYREGSFTVVSAKKHWYSLKADSADELSAGHMYRPNKLGKVEHQ